jgi:hypothetical protein
MDWRARLIGAAIRPANSGPMCAVWLDRFNRKIQIDWDTQRFVYLCAEADRPAAFTPGKSYPLALLFSGEDRGLTPPGSPGEVDSAKRWCPKCLASTDQERLSRVSWMCGKCNNVLPDASTHLVATEPKPRRKKAAEFKQLSLFGEME